MRQILSVILMTTMLFGGGYWYYTALAGCDIPMTYRVGSVDPRFGLTDDAVRNALSSAESLWEDATDRNIFTYDPKGEIVVNFVYDDRQQLTREQQELESILDQKEGMSESVKAEYGNLVSQYESLRATYEQQADAYEAKLTQYNKEVAEWNARGGAPKDVFERLESTQLTLSREEGRLNTLSTELNTLVRKINALGAQGNTLVKDYNSLVHEYNDTFSDVKEFTQGEYTNKTITIYEYKDEAELIIVLAHEFGHALGIDHVEGDSSIMYYHMGEQTLETGLTQADTSAFMERCGNTGSMIDTLAHIQRTLLSLLGAL